MSLNLVIMLEKLFFKNSRLNIFFEFRFTSSNEVSSFVLSFTFFNNVEVNILIYQIAKHNNKNLQIFKKLAKSCTFAIARFQYQKFINKTLFEVVERQHKKITRVKDYYDDVRIMNNEILKKRAQLIVSKIVKKIKNKSNKKMNQIIKIFMRLDSTIFAKNKHWNLKKKNITANSSTKSIFQLSSISKSFISKLSSESSSESLSELSLKSSASAKSQRRRASKLKFTLKQQSQALISSHSSRSERLIKSRNLNL